jgi:hypothetical protein
MCPAGSVNPPDARQGMSATSPPSPTPEQGAYLTRLAQMQETMGKMLVEMRSQTQAILMLVESNHRMIEAMAGTEDADPDVLPSVGLDGEPIRY